MKITKEMINKRKKETLRKVKERFRYLKSKENKTVEEYREYHFLKDNKFHYTPRT